MELKGAAGPWWCLHSTEGRSNIQLNGGEGLCLLLVETLEFK